MIGIVCAQLGLFSPLATDAERQHWAESGEQIADLDTFDSEVLTEARQPASRGPPGPLWH